MAMKYDEKVKRAAQSYYEMLVLEMTRGKDEFTIKLSNVPAWDRLPEGAREAHCHAMELALEAAAAEWRGAARAAADSYLERDMPPDERLHAMRGLDDVLRRVGALGYQGRLGVRGAAPSSPGYPGLAGLMQSPSARPGIFAAVEHLMVHSGCSDEVLGRMVVGLPEGAEEEYARIGAEVRGWYLRLFAGDDKDQRRMNAAMAPVLAGERPESGGGWGRGQAIAALERVRASCEAMLNAEAESGRGGRPPSEGGAVLTDTERAAIMVAGAAGFRTEPARPFVPAVPAVPARVLWEREG